MMSIIMIIITSLFLLSSLIAMIHCVIVNDCSKRNGRIIMITLILFLICAILTRYIFY